MFVLFRLEQRGGGAWFILHTIEGVGCLHKSNGRTNMRKLMMTSVLVAAALGGASQSFAGGYGGHHGYNGHGASFHHVQYGSYGGGYGGGYNHQPRCHWERKQVRIWDESYQRWVWVWRRVRICD